MTFASADLRPYIDQANQIIAFHRKTFGGYMMMADPTPEPEPTPDPPTPEPPAVGDPGFPANTPVAQMTLEQQVAYHKHQSRKHEERATAYHQAAGGKSAAEIKADLDAAETLRLASLSEHEQAIENARREAREAAARELGPKNVRAAFDLVLGHMDPKDRSEFIDDLDLTRFLTDSGEVDTVKVRARAEKIAPADKGTGGRRVDFGAGDRGSSRPTSGVAAGAALFAERKKSTTPS